MRGAHELAAQALQSAPKKATGGGSKSPEAYEARTRAIWQRMIQRFGFKWTKQFGEIPDQGVSSTMAEWGRGLDGLSNEQIRHGLDMVDRGGYEWPPGLPQFRELCRHRPAPVFRSLPAPPISKEQRQRFVGQLRRAVGGGK